MAGHAYLLLLLVVLATPALAAVRGWAPRTRLKGRPGRALLLEAGAFLLLPLSSLSAPRDTMGGNSCPAHGGGYDVYYLILFILLFATALLTAGVSGEAARAGRSWRRPALVIAAAYALLIVGALLFGLIMACDPS